MSGTAVAPHESGVFDQQTDLGAVHEQVTHFCDPDTGLRAIVAIHSTALGPALGGTRFYPYGTEKAALIDALRLSEGMTYKAAAAGLDLGGGKAVIIGDPQVHKTPELLRAYGRFVETLGGRYITAGDVGTTSDDMDVIGTSTRHVVGRTVQAGGSGDTGPSTAYGVFCSMQAAAAVRWGTSDLAGRTVGVEGGGKVGHNLIDLLTSVGAKILLTDPSLSAVETIRDQHPHVGLSDAVIRDEIDIYAPCAMGSTLTRDTVASLRAEIVCGAANNQLADRRVAAHLTTLGVTWVPDYIANAGGLIQANGERLGYAPGRVQADIRLLEESVTEVLIRADIDDVTTAQAADDLALRRLASSAAVR